MTRLIAKAFPVACIVVVMLSSVLTAATAEAAVEPQVVIAVDNTASAPCTKQVTTAFSTPNARTTTSACPVGTVISSKEVKLSEAIANKEKYVTLPPKPWTSEIAAKFDTDVKNLIRAKGNALRATTVKPHNQHPAITCDTQEVQLTYSWSVPSYPWYGVTITSSLIYSEASNCTAVYLENTSNSSSAGGYLDKMQYSSATWDPSCPDLSTTPQLNLSSWQNPGLYFEPFVKPTWPCGQSVVQHYINMGPVGW